MSDWIMRILSGLPALILKMLNAYVLCYQYEKDNPSLSATQSELQRNRATSLQKSLQIAAIP
jgi:hypothetical protein